MVDGRTLSSVIIKCAIDSGASLAGIANIVDMKKRPSFLFTPERPHIDRVGAVENETGLPEGVVDWPPDMKSALVIAYEHPVSALYLDWWLDWKNPPGNGILINTNKKVQEYIEAAYPQVKMKPLNYYVEKGGIWLKDAAVTAGLGVVGKNNLLVTPQFGPRVRLRAMLLSLDIPSTGPIDWDPCEMCIESCRRSCPQGAFDDIVYRPDDYGGLEELPGRTGCYNLIACDKQMAIDEENEEKGETDIGEYGKVNSILKYCRACELNCLVGK